MYKKIAALAMSVVLMLSMAACSAQNSSDAPGSDTSSAESISVPESVSAPEEEAAFPVTVKDAAGREVTIEEEPESWSAVITSLRLW